MNAVMPGIGQRIRLTGREWEGLYSGDVVTIGGFNEDRGFYTFAADPDTEWDLADPDSSDWGWVFEARVSDFEDKVRTTLQTLGGMLINKNKAYGESALNPVRIFSKADPVEQIMVRIDDKLSRLSRGSEYAGDDTVTDLLGYLVLLKIARDGQSDAVPDAE